MGAMRRAGDSDSEIDAVMPSSANVRRVNADAVAGVRWSTWLHVHQAPLTILSESSGVPRFDLPFFVSVVSRPG